MDLSYSEHARKRMAQREITAAMVQHTVQNPEFTEEQEDGCVRYYCWIQDLGTYIRVVCRDDFVITVLPDRKAKRRKK